MSHLTTSKAAHTKVNDFYAMDINHGLEDTVHETEEMLSCMQIFSPRLDTTQGSNGGGSVCQRPRTEIKDFPPEILGKVFEHCISDSDPAVIYFKSLSTPMKLAQVSWTWRSVAFSVPRLWNEVVVDYGDLKNIHQLAQATHNHLVHSNALPIIIHTKGSLLNGSPGPVRGDFIMNLLSPYANRIRHLTLSFPVELMNQFLQQRVAGFTIPVLESVTLVYRRMGPRVHLVPVNVFAHAPRLRTFEIKYALRVPDLELDLQWDQITELNFVRLIIPSAQVSSILRRCLNLQNCTLTVPKEYPFEETNFLPATDSILPSIRCLTLYNEKDNNYDNYLAGIEFPSLERLNVMFIGNQSKWEQGQFMSLQRRSRCTLRVLSTSAHVGHENIEAILGDVPSLTELDVLEGQPISASTLRLICNGLLAPNLEVLRCAVEPDMLSDFLDMLDCRHVPRKSRATYRGIKSAVVSCSKATEGYRNVRKRLKELKSDGRDVKIIDKS
ncbi:hypothetical protein D9615_002126 [Tricholomella constricta]|uniref:F-box domain-containing protein n=1 Tax=Tricholomella constricta TaxID=117010 RepID=A0A8H5HP24_9AGAR|nr:hypothetical protein D9615_002126 [Tricholomella constricta]